MNPEPEANSLAIQQPCRRFGIDEEMHPVQIAGFQRMSPGRKFAQVVQMYHAGISLAMAGVRMRHPDWNENQVRREAQRISTYGVA